MAHIVSDRIKETSGSSGLGAFTLDGPQLGFLPFSAVCVNLDTVFYCIASRSLNEWEVGLGTWGTGNILTRTLVLASSSGGAVNFGAGTKDVFLTVPAARLQAAPDGTIAAPGRSWISDPTIGDYKLGASTRYARGSLNVFALEANAPGEFGLQAAGFIGFAPGTDAAAASDCQLRRAAAGVPVIGPTTTPTVVSAATITATSPVFHVSGVTNITNITNGAAWANALITLIFDGVLTVIDGGNLRLNGNFVTSADDTLQLVSDGTNWFEVGRSAN